jgi:hypothetical protein
MIIDINGNGSFLFQSLDQTDQSIYTWDQGSGNAFVPVANLVIQGNIYSNYDVSFNVVTDTVSMGGSTAQIAVLPGYLVSNISTNSTSVSIANCNVTAADSTGQVYIQLPSGYTKSFGGAFGAGNTANGLGAGVTLGAANTYHVMAIRFANGASDMYVDTSISAANAPANTSFYRRLGSFVANSSALPIPFIQKNDDFVYSTWQFDSSLTTLSATPSAPTSLTLSVPNGIEINAIVNFQFTTAGSSNIQAVLYYPNIPNFSGMGYGAGFAGAMAVASISTGEIGASSASIRTNTNGQIKGLTSVAMASWRLMTMGYIDDRGKNGGL